jgi:hypothetical protein
MEGTGGRILAQGWAQVENVRPSLKNNQSKNKQTNKQKKPKKRKDPFQLQVCPTF